MEYNSDNGLRNKEVKVDMDISETQHEAQQKVEPNSDSGWWKKTLNKLISGVMGFQGSTDDGNICGWPNEMTGLLAEPSQGIEEKEKKKVGKIKKAPKPPRPPRGPSLDPADMRLIKEISKIAMKKRERIERIKALKKTKVARLPLSTTSSPSPSPFSSSSATISALVITVLFFLVLIFQGVGRGTSSNVRLSGAPQPAPETTGFTPLVHFYNTHHGRPSNSLIPTWGRWRLDTCLVKGKC